MFINYKIIVYLIQTYIVIKTNSIVNFKFDKINNH